MTASLHVGDQGPAEHKPMRLAIVGCGAVARLCHLPAIALIADCELTALVDADLSRASALRAMYGELASAEGVSISESVSEVLAEFDAALICTPHSTHLGLAIELLSAGKHVLVEKPLATTSAACDEIAQLAAKKGLVAAVGHVRRFFPAVPWVKQLLLGGELGAVRKVTWTEGFEFRWPSASLSMFDRDEAGGGVTLEAGAHSLDILLHWFGSGAEITGYCDDGPHGVESESKLRLRFGDVEAVVELSRLRRLANACVIEGSQATVRFDIDLDANFEISDPAGTILRSGRIPVLEPAASGWETLFADQIRHFLAAANCAPAAVVTAVEARGMVELAEACYRHPRRDTLAHPWKVSGRSGVKQLEGMSFAVTGASGFVGSRLSEELVTRHKAAVRAVVRQPSRLAQLAALDQRRLGFAIADVNEPAALAEAFAGAHVVIHCAHGSDGTDEERWRTTVEGTRNALKAAREAGVRRFVHVSTVSVFDREVAGEHLDEGSPLAVAAVGDLGYTAQKVAAQQLVTEASAAGAGMEIVIVQPTVIYGPWSPTWTVEPMKRLRTLSASLPKGDEGICNAVYIDDVVTALVLAAWVPEAAGESFVISGSRPESWGRFYDKYRELLPSDDQVAGGEAIPEWEHNFYLSGLPASIEKARSRLGYDPIVSLDEGMHRVGQWARWAGLVG